MEKNKTTDHQQATTYVVSKMAVILSDTDSSLTF